jgi:addiction module RelB/DinJ family antitoxin
MSTTSINVRTDSETKTNAQKIFKALGLDMTAAVNLFLRQTVSMKGLPFTPPAKTEPPSKPAGLPFGRDCMKGKMWMADDFDAPLEDMKEYME